MVPEELTTVARALVYFGFAFAIALSVPTFPHQLDSAKTPIRRGFCFSEACSPVFVKRCCSVGSIAFFAFVYQRSFARFLAYNCQPIGL